MHRVFLEYSGVMTGMASVCIVAKLMNNQLPDLCPRHQTWPIELALVAAVLNRQISVSRIVYLQLVDSNVESKVVPILLSATASIAASVTLRIHAGMFRTGTPKIVQRLVLELR